MPDEKGKLLEFPEGREPNKESLQDAIRRRQARSDADKERDRILREVREMFDRFKTGFPLVLERKITDLKRNNIKRINITKDPLFSPEDLVTYQRRLAEEGNALGVVFPQQSLYQGYIDLQSQWQATMKSIQSIIEEHSRQFTRDVERLAVPHATDFVRTVTDVNRLLSSERKLFPDIMKRDHQGFIESVELFRDGLLRILGITKP